MSDREVAYVRILHGPHKGGVYVLQGHSVYSIGRAPECQIRIELPSLNLRHAFLTMDEGAWCFRDPQGNDNCFVNDIPTRERNLEGGEIIRIGREIELFFSFNKPAAKGSEKQPARVEAPPKTHPPTMELPAGINPAGTTAAPRRDVTQEEVPHPTPQEAVANAQATRLSGIRLVVVDGDPRDIGKELILPLEGELFVGRSPDCALSLHDRKMSRKHCRIERDGDRYRVSDLSSLNGTVVNGLRAASARFGVGDYIRLGFTVVAVQRVRETAQG